MTDELMAQFTWKGQVKANSAKQAGLSLEKTQLKSVIYGKRCFFFRNYNMKISNVVYIWTFTEAVLHGVFENTDLKIMNQISSVWVQKTGDRIRDKKKRIAKKLLQEQNLEEIDANADSE